MDEDQIDLAEKIYQKALESGGLPDLMFAQFILTREEQSEPKFIKGIKSIINVLVYQGLLNSEPKKSSNYITPAPLSINFKSYYDFLEFQNSESNKEKAKELREEKKYELEIENLQLQIIHQRQWFWKVLVGALIVEVVQFYFIFINK